MHGEAHTEIMKTVQLSCTDKRHVIDSIDDETAYGLLTVRFTYRKPGMVELRHVLFEFCENETKTELVNVPDLLTSNEAVLDCARRKAAAVGCEIKDSVLPKVMLLGGGVSYKGLKQLISGK